MKEKVLLTAAAFLGAMVLTGCSLFETANGIVLYGDEEKVLSSLEEEHKGQIEKDSYSVKIIEADDKRALVMDEATAKVLIEKELLKKVEGDDAKAISELPKISEGEGVIFAKTSDDASVLGGMDLTAKYEGNIIIGDGRAYVDMFLVVTEEDLHSISGTDKTIGVIQYNKDPDGIGAFGVDREQLVRIAEK
ncbi:lipoprotein BA_5634 family protein [Planococcus sp. CAU13]|uniref:lipoprotein BA_5634 family protein n=1 Tax=Planococcus sp. CAU13 TaxID=1541197 RepID=UPI00052FEC5E|nr:lipoprotein BA_5634 family protein [Planococcus sp. CAU13]